MSSAPARALARVAPWCERDAKLWTILQSDRDYLATNNGDLFVFADLAETENRIPGHILMRRV